MEYGVINLNVAWVRGMRKIEKREKERAVGESQVLMA